MHDKSSRADAGDVTGILHQGILSLFQEDPWLGFDLLGIAHPVEGLPVDRRAEAEVSVEGSDFRVRRSFPDLVMVARGPDDRKPPAEPVGVVVIIEAQKRRDWRKRWRFPFCQAALANEHELPCWMVVVSFCDEMSADLRAWSEGPPPKIDVLLLDVHTVPATLDPEFVRGRPTASVLCAALHAYRGNIEAARVGLLAIRDLEPRRRHRHTSIILAAVPKNERSKLMDLIPYEEQDELLEIEMNSGTFHLGLEQGRESGRRAVLKDMILALLEVRGVVFDGAVEAKVRGHESLATLQVWAQRAREVTSVTQLFEPCPSA